MVLWYLEVIDMNYAVNIKKKENLSSYYSYISEIFPKVFASVCKSKQ